MNITYENKLAFRITGVLLLLFIFSFGIFIFLNYELALDREKKNFRNNLKTIPSEYVINLLKGGDIHKNINNHNIGIGKVIYKKLFRNVYIKIGDKEFKRGIFTENDIGNNIIDNIGNKQIKVFKFSHDKILAYKLKSNDIVLVIGKNIDYIFEGIHRLIYIALIITFFAIFTLFYISLKLSYKTTKNIKLANKKLREYNHNLAHELKTPLAVMKSDLELLEMSKKIDLDIVSSAKNEINNMQSIIDSLLFLVQKNNNIKFEKVNITKIIKDIIDFNFIENKNDISLVLDKNIIKRINKNLFEILIKNLLKNSIKYGNLKKKISIILEKDRLVISNFILEKNKNIDKNKLFDSFYMSDSSRNSKGFGLGLSIVKKVVDLHNFKINIDIKNDLFIVTIVFN